MSSSQRESEPDLERGLPPERGLGPERGLDPDEIYAIVREQTRDVMQDEFIPIGRYATNAKLQRLHFEMLFAFIFAIFLFALLIRFHDNETILTATLTMLGTLFGKVVNLKARRSLS